MIYISCYLLMFLYFKYIVHINEEKQCPRNSSLCHTHFNTYKLWHIIFYLWQLKLPPFYYWNKIECWRANASLTTRLRNFGPLAGSVEVFSILSTVLTKRELSGSLKWNWQTNRQTHRHNCWTLISRLRNVDIVKNSGNQIIFLPRWTQFVLDTIHIHFLGSKMFFFGNPQHIECYSSK